VRENVRVLGDLSRDFDFSQSPAPPSRVGAAAKGEIRPVPDSVTAPDNNPGPAAVRGTSKPEASPALATGAERLRAHRAASRWRPIAGIAAALVLVFALVAWRLRRASA
jgi:hypothetical protein